MEGWWEGRVDREAVRRGGHLRGQGVFRRVKVNGKKGRRRECRLAFSRATEFTLADKSENGAAMSPVFDTPFLDRGMT